MLNSWVGAVRFLARLNAQNSQSIEVAKVLGWMVNQKGKATDTQLNSWEGAVRFLPRHDAVNSQPVEIAKVLGWMRFDSNSSVDRMNDVTEDAYKMKN